MERVGFFTRTAAPTLTGLALTVLVLAALGLATSGSASARQGPKSAPAPVSCLAQQQPALYQIPSISDRVWFSVTPRSTRRYTVLRMVVYCAPTGSQVLVTCRGRGCPFARKSLTVFATVPCGRHKRRRCPTNGTLHLESFANRRLRVGARVTIAIVRQGWNGVFYVISITRRGAHMAKACLAPGATVPGLEGC